VGEKYEGQCGDRERFKSGINILNSEIAGDTHVCATGRAR
jgi:hypothetical protein